MIIPLGMTSTEELVPQAVVKLNVFSPSHVEIWPRATPSTIRVDSLHPEPAMLSRGSGILIMGSGIG